MVRIKQFQRSSQQPLVTYVGTPNLRMYAHTNLASSKQRLLLAVENECDVSRLTNTNVVISNSRAGSIVPDPLNGGATTISEPEESGMLDLKCDSARP